MVSAFAFGGIPERAVKKAIAATDIYVSPALLNEYRNVPLELKLKSKITHIQFEALIIGIASFVAESTIVFPERRLSVCRDPKDNMVFECCLEAQAGFLITGDRDVFDAVDLPFALKILTPREYIEQ